MNLFVPLNWRENCQNWVDPEVSDVRDDEDPDQIETAEGCGREEAGDATRVDVVGQHKLEQLRKVVSNLRVKTVETSCNWIPPIHFGLPKFTFVFHSSFRICQI